MSDYERMVAEEQLIFDFTEDIARVMDERNLTNRDIAKMIGRSESWVSRLLGGKRNLTMRSVARIAYALDLKFEVKLVER